MGCSTQGGDFCCNHDSRLIEPSSYLRSVSVAVRRSVDLSSVSAAHYMNGHDTCPRCETKRNTLIKCFREPARYRNAAQHLHKPIIPQGGGGGAVGENF